MAQSDFLFRGELAELDPDVAELIRHETARQERALILIPSESTIPEAVREALMSAFHNIYAEGYPLDETRMMTQQEILNYNARLPEYRRFADKRYYKGTEYADVVEALQRGDVDLRAGGLGDAADGFAAGPDEQADLFGIDLDRLDARGELAEVGAGRGRAGSPSVRVHVLR